MTYFPLHHSSIQAASFKNIGSRELKGQLKSPHGSGKRVATGGYCFHQYHHYQHDHSHHHHYVPHPHLPPYHLHCFFVCVHPIVPATIAVL